LQLKPILIYKDLDVKMIMEKTTQLYDKLEQLRIKLDELKKNYQKEENKTNNCFKNNPYEDFTDFVYSKKSHWEYFKNIDIALYGRRIDKFSCDLKQYQDFLVYKFIKEKIPAGSKILEIGGGNSRIANYFKKYHEFWIIDKLEGIGSGPREIKNQDVKLIRDYIGEFNLELPDDYFDFVFSISVLEHVERDEKTLKNILKDINRVLKKGGYSMQCIDTFIKENKEIRNPIAEYFISKQKMLFKFKDYKKISQNVDKLDLWYMSKKAFIENWLPHFEIKKEYGEIGLPFSTNLFWKK